MGTSITTKQRNTSSTFDPFFFSNLFLLGVFLGTETFFSSLYNLYRPIVCVFLCLCLPRPRSGGSGRCTNLPIIYNNYTLTGEQGSLLWGEMVLANTRKKRPMSTPRASAQGTIRSIVVRCLAKYGLLSFELTALCPVPSGPGGRLHCTALLELSYHARGRGRRT